MIKALLTIPALLVAGVAFVVMFPILGVTLWVSFLVAGVSALAYTAAAGGLVLSAKPETPRGERSRHDERVRMNPIVDVAVLRGRYFLTMALAAAGGFLVVETFAFAQSTANRIGFAIGIAVTLAASAVLWLHASRPESKQVIGLPWSGPRVAVWDAIATLCITVGVWQIVQSLVFSGATTRWLGFADGCGLLGLAIAGLVLHELSTERVVHSLEVIDARASGTSVEAEREPVHA